MDPTSNSFPIPRCPWASTALIIQYHDREWGVPQHDDRVLFEFLVLEGAQAGLSWSTILQKRDNYRRAFDHFDARKVARYDARKVTKLLADPGIVRNRLKIAAAIQNAKAFLAVQKEFGSFDAYIWRFVGGRPIRNAWKTLKQLPARTPASEAMSKDLLAAASSSSARRSATPSCKPWGWSTTTWWVASAIGALGGAAVPARRGRGPTITAAGTSSAYRGSGQTRTPAADQRWKSTMSPQPLATCASRKTLTSPPAKRLASSRKPPSILLAR